MSGNEVLTEARDNVLIITLNRPEAKNAANRALALGIAAAMDQLEADDDLRVAVLTGAGGTFCSGMDLKAFVSGETPVIEGRGFAGLAEYRSTKPLIAAVEGYALAGGFELAISCDLIVAAAGGLVKLPRQIPYRIAMELALTGDFVSAERVYELGLINRVVPTGTALEEALGLAATIAANGPLAVAASLKTLSSALDWSSDEMMARQNEIIAPVIGSEDAIEGSVAFAEKRAPVWKGK